MSIQYQVLWRNPAGELIGVFDSINGLDLAYAEGAVGGLSLIIPEVGLTPNDFTVDQIIEFHRGEQGNLYLEGERSWFLRTWEFRDGLITLKCVDQNCLLGARVIAYNAETAYTDKTGAADNLMKAFVRENIGALAVDTARTQTQITVQSDNSAAPSTTKQCTREKLLTVLQGLAKSSAEAGTYLSFDLVNVGAAAFEFRTYTGQRGADHGLAGGNILEFSKGAGNVSSLIYREDHSNEETYCYAGGLGQEENRVVVGVASAGMTASPWNRREFFWDGRNTDDVSALTTEAQSELRERRSTKMIEAVVQQTQGCRYGIEYRYGDRVVVSAAGWSVDCRLSTVHISVNSKGKEIIDLKLRGEW